MELGNALETILSGLANIVAQEALKYTVLSGKSSCLYRQQHAPRSQPTLVPDLCTPGAQVSQAPCWTIGTWRGEDTEFLSVRSVGSSWGGDR